MNVRRVVTGCDATGKAVFVSDEKVEPITLALLPGTEFHRLWGADTIPELPTDGAPSAHHTYFPPAGGFRWGFFTLGPAGDGTAPNLDIDAALRATNRRLFPIWRSSYQDEKATWGIQDLKARVVGERLPILAQRLPGPATVQPCPRQQRRLAAVGRRGHRLAE